MLWDGGWSWMVLALALFFATFGFLGFLGGIYIVFLIGGGLVIAYHYGKQHSQNLLHQSSCRTRKAPPGLQKVFSSMQSCGKCRNYDRRMTGASVIDEALQEVLDYAIRDYISSWYRQLSYHEGFLVHIRQCVQKVIITFANKSKEVDWMPYFTQKLVDDFASHIRLYRRAAEKLKRLPKDDNPTSDKESMFFDLEVDMENNMCRDSVCTSPDDERQYLQDLSEVLLFLLLPKEDFHNKPFRYIIREVIVNGVFLPTVELLSDPDYINQTIAWLCKESSFTNEIFMTVIKTSDDENELEAVREMVSHDITRWRSKDTGGADDTVIKQNLNSLRFLQKLCDNRTIRLQGGKTDPELQSEEHEFFKAQNLFVLTLEDILNNGIALSIFIEFMTSVCGEQYLFFYLNVEGFRVAAEEQISAAHAQKLSEGSTEPDLESLRRAAMIIYQQYLSEKASSKIRVEPELVKKTLQNIKSKMLTEDAFDDVQFKVHSILCGEQYYESFLQSKMYVKLLAELGLLPESKTEDGNTLNIDDVPRIIWFQPEDDLNTTDDYDVILNPGECVVSAHVTQTGIVKESEKSGKSYAVYAVTVKKKMSVDEEMWDIYRRYSDFHDLHMIVTEKFSQLIGLSLPGKTAFKNTNKEFLEKRRKGLDSYLQVLMNPDLWRSRPGLEDLMVQFLAPGLWEKHKSELARKMDTIVNPLRSSVRSVGTAVKHMPDMADGLGKVFNVKGLTANLSHNEVLDSGKVGAGLDPEVGENIPLRIMLLLMDEVFDLRHKNQWLRRRIVAILRQLLKATFGDMINRKIVEHVDWLTSAEQMAEYVKTFRDSFWPLGILAEPRPSRDHNTKMRTRVVCKVKMLGSISDEMRHLMGNETIKMGVMRVFDMFQHKNLNKRLVYVFLEGVIVTLFPQNRFPDIFRKLHSRSPRVKLNTKKTKESVLHHGIVTAAVGQASIK